MLTRFSVNSLTSSLLFYNSPAGPRLRYPGTRGGEDAGRSVGGPSPQHGAAHTDSLRVFPCETLSQAELNLDACPRELVRTFRPAREETKKKTW